MNLNKCKKAMGVQLSWESTCFASRGSSVRSRLSPPRDSDLNQTQRGKPSTPQVIKESTRSKLEVTCGRGKTQQREKWQRIKIWAYSSAGQSVRLISGRSMVRVHLSPPNFPLTLLFRLVKEKLLINKYFELEDQRKEKFLLIFEFERTQTESRKGV